MTYKSSGLITPLNFYPSSAYLKHYASAPDHSLIIDLHQFLERPLLYSRVNFSSKWLERDAYLAHAAPSRTPHQQRSSHSNHARDSVWRSDSNHARGAYTKSFDPEFSAYYGTVKSLEFRLEVPANTKPGRYTLKLTGQVRFCSKTQHLCVSDTLEVPYWLEVGNPKKPNLHAFALIGLTGEDALEER